MPHGHLCIVSVCHMSYLMGPKTFFKKQKVLRERKSEFFFLEGPKLKRVIFAWMNNIFEPK